VLDPIARVSEILFGLIMALTFTGTLGAATAGREEVRTLLVGAIGCNIAWGLVDAVMFLMSSLTERGRGLLTIRAVHNAASPQQAHGVIAGAVPPVLAKVLSENDLENIRQGLLRLGELPPGGLGKRDWLGALAVFLLVFLSTFPVVIPFLVVQNVQLALRLSNLVAIAMMFVCGILLGRHGGYHPWRTGFSVVLLGVLLVGITIVLGG
jgi:VIT1/CCC1 family predicted Fe2+/Mn2+ transporter